MGKTIFLTIHFLLFFLPKILVASPQPDAILTNCPLPPPQSVSIVGVTPTGISLSWTPVPTAARYRVNVYDQTDQNALPAAYTTSASIVLEELATGTHQYLIGVSASACATGNEFGDEVFIEYKPGIIIIVDVIVQLNCPGAGMGIPPNTNPQQFNLPFNSGAGEEMQTKRIRVTGSNNANLTYVDFLIWVDCFTQVRFCELSSQGAKRIPNGNTIKYVFLNNSSPFFDIENGNCDINMCSVFLKYHAPCLVSQGHCSIQNNPYSCGEKQGDSAHLLVAQGESPAVSVEAHLKQAPKRRGPDTLHSSSLKVAPNPFSDHIDIQFDLSKPESVSIKMFHVTGAVACQPVPLQNFERGVHTVEVSLPDALPEGLYFLELQTEDERIVTPMIKQ